MKARALAFTLVETMIVLMIIAVVLWVSVPAYQGYVERARILETVATVGEMSKGIRKYEMTNGALPNSVDELLAWAVANNYVLSGSGIDPWGRPYEYFNLRTAKGNGQARKDKKLAPLNSDFDLYSVGRDGVTAASLGNKASRDDIVRARDGGFIGTAEEFDP